ncbi:MAG: hypothetical protein KKE30_01705 [Gammaproteobacteria bacterium]|nr:hypothetical protein [Gammaproteobacteria bacterium]
MAKDNLKEAPKATIDGITMPEAPEQKYPDYDVEVITDFDGMVDPFYLSQKDSKYEFRFLLDTPQNLKEKTSNLLYLKGGWKLCPGDYLIRQGIVRKEELSPDGFYRAGFNILAFMPKELFIKKRQHKDKQNKAPMDAVERLIRDGDRDNPELKGRGSSTQLGLQTQRQLRMD